MSGESEIEYPKTSTVAGMSGKSGIEYPKTDLYGSRMSGESEIEYLRPLR